MPRVHTGGIYGLTEPDLASVYGQLLLQILQALSDFPGSGWPILRAGLRSRIRFHRLTAAEALSGWNDSLLNAAVFAETAAALVDCQDNETRAVLNAILMRSRP